MLKTIYSSKLAAQQTIAEKRVAIYLLNQVMENAEIKEYYPSLLNKCSKVAREIEDRMSGDECIIRAIGSQGGVSQYWENG